MQGIKYNTVFVVIDIRRILKIPVTVVNRNRDHPVILSGRMVDAACISFVFLTQQAFGITALLCQFGSGDRFRVFFRLG